MAINQRQIKDLVFVDITAAKAAGRPGEICYVQSLNTFYEYVVSGAAYTANDTSILTTGNGGDTRWRARAGAYVDGDIDYGGKYATQLQNIPDLAAKGPGFWFDGVDDRIVTPNFELPVNYVSAEWLFVCDNVLLAQRLFSRGSDAAGNDLALRIDAGEIKGVVGVDGSGTFSGILTPISSNTIYHVMLVLDAVDSKLKLYIDGALKTDNICVSTMGGLNDEVFIGIRPNFAEPFQGTIFYGRIYNKIISETEVKALSSGAPVPYKYLGASQTDILSGWDFTAVWTTNDATVIDADTFTVDVDAGYVARGSLTTIGKRYRCRIAGTAAVGITNLRVQGAGTGIYTQNITGTFDETFEFTASSDIIWLLGKGTGQVDITTLEVTQIGCVLQLESPGIGHTQWQDNSGNELHGNVSGALPTNLPADNVERFRHTVAITGDTTFTSVIPAGYVFESLILNNTGAGALTGDLGTTSGAHDVFQNQSIPANTITNIVISKMFSESAAQTLYLNDDSTPGWTNVSLTATFISRRVI